MILYKKDDCICICAFNEMNYTPLCLGMTISWRLYIHHLPKEEVLPAFVALVHVVSMVVATTLHAHYD